MQSNRGKAIKTEIHGCQGLGVMKEYNCRGVARGDLGADCGGSYMTLYICHNLENYTPKKSILLYINLKISLDFVQSWKALSS